MFTSHTKVKAKRPKEDFMDEKSTWGPTWRTMDKVSWSPITLLGPPPRGGLDANYGNHNFF